MFRYGPSLPKTNLSAGAFTATHAHPWCSNSSPELIPPPAPACPLQWITSITVPACFHPCCLKKKSPLYTVTDLKPDHITHLPFQRQSSGTVVLTGHLYYPHPPLSPHPVVHLLGDPWCPNPQVISLPPPSWGVRQQTSSITCFLLLSSLRLRPPKSQSGDPDNL